MPGARQEILVKIKALVEGLGNVRELSRLVDGMQGGKGAAAGQGSQVAALAGNIDRLSAAVDRLATSSAKTEKSRGGFVRFLVGVSAIVNVLSSVPQAFEGIKKLLDFFDNISGPLSSALGAVFGKVKEGAASLGSTVTTALAGVSARVGPALAGVGSAAAGVGAALAAALPVILAVGAALAALLAALTPLLIGFGGLAAAVAAGAAGLALIAARGLEVQRQLEQVRLGIAAVITSLADIKVDGLPVDGAEKFRVAMQLAGEQLQKLKVDAVNTVATFGQIAPAFQAAIGPGLAAKLTLDEIRAITVKVVQAAGAISLPLEQVNQEVRAILEGTINEDARLAKVLGISNKMVASWKAQGTLAAELNKRLEGFAIAGAEAANTLDGLTSNLEEALSVFSGEATQRAFAALKQEFARLLPQLFDFKNAGIAAQFKSLAALADEVLVRLIRIGGGVVQSIVNGVKRIADFVAQNRGLVNDVLNLAEAVLRQLFGILGVFGRLSTDTNTWRAGLELARGVLVLINVVLGAVASQLREIAPLLRFAALAAASLIAADPALRALGQTGPGVTTGGAVNQQDLDNEDQRLRDKQSGRRITVTPAPRLGGGGGGGKKTARRSQLKELTEQAEDAALGTDRARVERAFNLTRDFLERQSELIERNLDERRVSIARYYEDEERIQRETIEAEVRKLDELYALEEQARDRAKARAVADKDLTAPEKEQKKRVADEQFKQAVIPMVERLNILDRERLDLASRITQKRKEELKAFEEMLRDVNEQLALETGDTGGAIEAARRRIDEANRERLERIAAEKGAGSTEHQQAAQLVEVLKKKAEYQLLYNQLRQQEESLRFAEERIRADVDRGLITEKVGREQIVEAQLKHRAAVEETIASLRDLATASGDPELILDAEKAAEGIKDLGRVIDEQATRINASLKEATKDTIFEILRNPTNALSAITRLFNHFLDEISRLATDRLFDYVFGPNGVLGGIFGNKTGGGIGGVLSDIFGTRPQTPQGTPQAAGGGGGTPPFVGNLFSIIKGFQSNAVGGLFNVNASTGKVGDITDRGFAQVTGLFGQAIPLLGTISNATQLQAAAAVAATATSILQTFGVIGPKAAGGPVVGPGTGTSDSILARLSNGEFVIKAASVRSVGPRVLEYINRVGAVPQMPRFALGGLVEVGNIEPPAGGVVSESYTVHAPVTIQANDVQSFRGNEQAVRREIARGVQQGIQRAQARKKAGG